MLAVRSAPLAVALVAAAYLLWGLACGGGDEGPPPSTPTATASPVGSPTASAEPVAGATMDLAEKPPLLTVSGFEIGTQLAGTPSVGSGDFNGDGTGDLVVGLSLADGPDGDRAEAGAAYVFFGGDLEGSIDADDADVVVHGAAAGDSVGYSVLGGDINADGIDDLIVSGPGVTGGWDLRTDQGRVYVFFGADDLQGTFDLLDDPQDFVVTGAEGFSRLGHAVALGDMNDDGTDDLVLGAPFAGREPGSPPGSQRTTLGEAYVVFGGADLPAEVSIPSLEQDATFSGAEAYGQFGAAVASADVNGDGIDDVIVGAHRSGPDAARGAGGAVYVFYGRRDLGGRTTIQDGGQDATILGAAAGYALGSPLATGDFNGDGVPDIAAGAQSQGTGDLPSAGAVHVLFGGPGISGTIDLNETPSGATILGAAGAEVLPSALLAADLNGDGLDDLVAGSPFVEAPDGRQGAGRVYVVLGRDDIGGAIELRQGQQSLALLGATANNRLGGSLATGVIVSDDTVLLLVSSSFIGPESGQATDGGEVYAIRLAFE